MQLVRSPSLHLKELPEFFVRGGNTEMKPFFSSRLTERLVRGHEDVMVSAAA
ncbi:hypothetical protein SOVF_207700, partial [Spinacia oleracea]